MRVILDSEIVEERPGAEVFAHPQHDYTRTLLDAVPRLDGPRIAGAAPEPAA